MTFQHRAGVSPYTSAFAFAETCVFGKQSPGPLHCGLLCRHPFSLSYGVILPSSLTRVLSLALGFSPHLPASVCSTGTCSSFSSFSCQCETFPFTTCLRYASYIMPSRAYFTTRHTLYLHRLYHQPARMFLLCPCFIISSRWCWNLNQLSIGYDFTSSP